MFLSILLFFLAALLAPVISKIIKKGAGYFWAVVVLIPFSFYLSKYNLIKSGETLSSSFNWVPTLDINLAFHLDGLSLLFVLLISGIGSLIFIYSNGYMKDEEKQGRFYCQMLIFAGAMIGLVMADNLLVLFAFWELTSISSFLLIGFQHKDAKARSAALQALLITEFGGLCLLAGFIFIGNIGGSYEITELLAKQNTLTNHPFYFPLLLLILIGAFTKSAQFPFHFWLPAAMKAPTPVSAYLHSAAMVNAGIYLLARLNPVLGNTGEWLNMMMLFGGITAVIGAYFSLTQKNLKAILAYTTISALGILIMLLGVGSYLAVKAAFTYLVIHAFYKATLFMVAGTIDKKTGTRDLDKLGNLKEKIPIITVVAFLALLSMAGLPPMMGYIGKEFIYEAAKQASGVAGYVITFSIIANVFMMAISIIFGYEVFFRKKQGYKKIKKPGFDFWFGPAILALLSLVLVFFSKPVEPLLEHALASVKAAHVEVDLKLWHGFNIVFFLSLATIIFGFLLFAGRKIILPFLEKINSRVITINLSAAFENFIGLLLSFAKKNTRFFQHGYYRFYLMVIFVLTAALVWYQLFSTWTWQFLQNLSPISIYALSIAVMIIIAAVSVIFTKSRLAAIITMGVVGYGLALIYLLYGAVDVAITQILVETLTLVLFVFIFHNLPPFIKRLSTFSKIRDGVIALAVGGFMTALVLKSDYLRLNQPVSKYIAENSYTEASGRNIVNVILVDFRAFDTLGETMVIVIASLGIYALLKFKKKRT